MKYNFSLKGVCPSKLEFELDGNTVHNISFQGGCNGNLKALSILADGMTVDQVREKLLGVTCGLKKTSCSDQLAQALIKALDQESVK